MRVYSCYFSPNDPFEIFETQILLLEESRREASGNDLIVLNQGRDFMFRRGAGGGVDYRPHVCRASSFLKDSRLVLPPGNDLE